MKSSMINTSEICGGRFDPYYHREEFKIIEQEIINSSFDSIILEELFEINRGGSPRPINDYFTNDSDGVNWIKIGDTKNVDKYICTTKQKIKPSGVRHSRLVHDGDLILSNSMSFGRPYIMKTTGCIHDGWLLLRRRDKSINLDFAYFLLGLPFIYKLFKK